MEQLYKYTKYNQDGTVEDLGISKQKSFKELYKIIGCDTIEIIPPEYYENRRWSNCTVYGDEEGRFNTDNHVNPHFSELAPGWNVVGNTVKEEVVSNV